jgi:hypothetical protein
VHELFVTLEEGWIPDRPDWSAWGYIWSPEFVAEVCFRTWLPDDTYTELTPPRAPQIDVSRGLCTTLPYQ